ncbi:MAG TPA: proton-conducting transporter membrane subunit [Actinomycetaceae bacterium]|nr:proton-conducting transporter membrane subunit [Actinomycetaceae bacterium]
MSALVLLPPLLPLAGAVAAALTRERAAGVVAVVTAALTAAAGAVVVALVVTGGTQTYLMSGWEPPLGIVTRVDGLSAALLAMTSLVGLAITVYATAGSSLRGGRGGWPLWLGLWSGLNVVYVSGDLFNIYIGLELLSIAAVALVAGGGREARRGAMRYLVVAVAGSLLFLLGVGLLYGNTATLDLVQAGTRLSEGPDAVVALAAMVAGLGLKTALFPAHGWLPPAHSAAPAAVSPMLSALVVKASFYVIVRVWFDVYGDLAPPGGAVLLGLFGTGAVAWGATLALRQRHLKRVVAYSTVAQLGYLFLLFPLATPALAGNDADTVRLAWLGIFGLLMAHGVAKAAMFLAAGAVAARHGTDELAKLPGAVATMPVAMFAFGMAGVSLAALPPSFGFLGKWNLLQASFGSGQWWWAVVLIAGGLGTAAYTARVLRLTYSGPDDDVEAPELTPLPRRAQVVPLLLAVLAVGIGLGSGELLQLSLIGGEVGT